MDKVTSRSRTRRYASRLGWLLLVVALTLLAVRIYDSQRGPPLELWHTYVPEELDADELEAADWPRYTSTTDRWRPRFDSYRVPEQVSLRPGIFWKAFLDAGAMLLLFAMIDGAASLRLAGLTPKLVALP